MEKGEEGGCGGAGGSTVMSAPLLTQMGTQQKTSSQLGAGGTKKQSHWYFFYFLNSLFPRSQKWFPRHFFHLIGKYLVFKIGLIFSFYAPEVQFLKVRKEPSGGVVLSFFKLTKTVKILVTINHINY